MLALTGAGIGAGGWAPVGLAAYPLLVIGFLGGYTTFSSFEWETYSAIREGGFWIGLANVLGSVLFGYAAV